jgi:hypothetical protein
MIVVYGVLALVGLIGPWYFNVQFMTAHGGFVLGTFLADIFANPASSSVGVDITIGATAFLVWMVSEARKLGMRHWWVYIVLTFAVAFAFACPFFLFMRERRLRSGLGVAQR